MIRRKAVKISKNKLHVNYKYSYNYNIILFVFIDNYLKKSRGRKILEQLGSTAFLSR